MNGTVVIIGAGISGLTAANLLARRGYEVVVFEAGAKAGGCCATTTLDGYTFNDGAVYLGVLGALNHAFAKIGLDRPALLPLRKITASYSATLPDGASVTVGEGLDVRVTGRAVDADRLQRELRAMMQKWQPVLRSATEHLFVHPFSYWRTLRKAWRYLPLFRGTVASEVRALFSDDAVRAALSGAVLYGGLPAARMPVAAILGLVAEMGEGFFLPEGGMGRVPEVLRRALEGLGGCVFLNSPVDGIVIEGGRVRGVEVKGRGRADAAAVISTTGAMATFGKLVEARCVPSDMARKARHARLSRRAVSIQFGLANRIDAPAHSVSVLPWMEQQDELFAQDGREVKYPVYLVPTVTMPELAPPGGSIVEMFYPVKAEIPLEYWDDAAKLRLAESAAAVLRRTHRLDVAVTRVRSPRDFAESMRLFQGALYGLSPAVAPREYFPHRTGIPGLYLAGQTTYPGYGVGAAMMSGIFAAEAFARNY